MGGKKLRYTANVQVEDVKALIEKYFGECYVEKTFNGSYESKVFNVILGNEVEGLGKSFSLGHFGLLNKKYISVMEGYITVEDFSLAATYPDFLQDYINLVYEANEQHRPEFRGSLLSVLKTISESKKQAITDNNVAYHIERYKIIDQRFVPDEIKNKALFGVEKEFVENKEQIEAKYAEIEKNFNDIVKKIVKGVEKEPGEEE